MLEVEEIQTVEQESVCILPPWITDPYRLMTWWGMEKFAAAKFYELTRLLSYVERHFVQQIQAVGAYATIEPSKGDGTGETFLSKLTMVCTQLSLKTSLKCVQYISSLSDSGTTYGQMKEATTQLQRTIQWEMEEKLFMYIPPTRAERFNLPEAFGADVARNFPSATFDIWEAGNSFAAGRSTACVFHLMRVLELGLIPFATIFGVPADRENWHPIIERIESKIRDMGKDPNKLLDWKEKQESYSQIANSFMFFKDAWRNYTAHARGKYIEDEADAIYRNVGSFMKRLASSGIRE
jgi:hypothetical protein